MEMLPCAEAQSLHTILKHQRATVFRVVLIHVINFVLAVAIAVVTITITITMVITVIAAPIIHITIRYLATRAGMVSDVYAVATSKARAGSIPR
ncbi:hypothetical protein CLIM01_14930 [Colletotrichum limetticola]|uniref:ABC transmembrane type-1 domain-containing protein n=1 Tax=Colletotrichum limetticola TaxID=1209924 RepID=A0ABQ9P877_9PEZI|nr:hypothetical protein CLIM01_14930 [Colletotrichum limetticola]